MLQSEWIWIMKLQTATGSYWIAILRLWTAIQSQ
jgi:hypothetical protein